MQVESTSKPMLAVDEVDQFQRRKLPSLLVVCANLPTLRFLTRALEKKSKTMPWLRYSTFQSKTPHLRDVGH